MSSRAAKPDASCPEEVLAAMVRGAAVLTPNVRSARVLSRIYDGAQRSAGLAAWRPARVFSWKGWTASLWNDAILHGKAQSLLLNALQEQALWTRILEASGDLGLQSAASVARQCSHAMGLLGAYDLEDRFSRSASDGVPDASAFAGWYREFVAACREDGLLPASHLDAELGVMFRQRTPAPNAEYLLYGFDRLLPSQHALVDSLRQAGASVQEMPAHMPQRSAPALVICEDRDAEISACCAWIQTILKAQPGARIAVVVPDLASCRPELERALRSTVAPWMDDVTRTHRRAPYDFSTGRPMAQLPMAADAFRLLRWCSEALPLDDVGAILRSPFFTLASTPERGAELEAWVLRKTRLLRSVTGLSGKVSLREADRMLRNSDADTAHRLQELARAAANATQGLHGYAEHSDHAQALLKVAGWGQNELDSVEFQAMQRWNEVLDRIATLDIFGRRIGFAKWLETLASALHDTVFAPENTGAPVQVMTPSEAAGSTSDFLWFLHGGDGAWPLRSAMNPLLPAGFQRALAMPGAEHLLDEEAARQVTLRCVNSTAAARFSYAAITDGGESRPSPLIASLPGLERVTADVPGRDEILALEEIRDTSALPELTGVAAGGVGLLTEQGQCGFRSFAQHRLQLREMEAIDAGQSAGERGEDVHAVLQEFWNICKTHKQLQELTRDVSDGVSARDILLAECIDRVLPDASAGWDSAYLEVQRKRLQRLLSDWLDVELLRTPFRVEAMEKEVADAAVGPLPMKMRVDRIDRVTLPDGSEANLLIDYKTGNAERKDWFGERPDAPQLPLYAIAGGIPEVQGIAFGRVRVGRNGMDFQEMLADRSLLGDKAKNRRTEPTFEERMAEWRHDITALAEAFARGEAVVEPKDYLLTCKRCPSRMLCRVDVSRLEPDDDLLDEPEEEGGL